MKSKIISQNKNPFLHREEFVIEIQADTNPSFEDIKKELGKDNDLTVVKKINSGFGTNIFTAEVFVYDSKELKDKIEKQKKSKKAKSEQVQTAQPASVEQPVKQVAEQKSEEKKEETKKEDKE